MKIKKEKIVKLLYTEIKERTFLRFLSLVFVVFLLSYLYDKGIISPLFVNGEPVSLSEILESYREGGPDNLLDRIVAEKIVEIEARKRNIELKEEEIAAEIDEFERKAIENGKTLTQILAEKDKTLAQLEKETKVRLTLYKILGSSVSFDEEEIDRVIEENPWLYKDDAEMEEVREEVRDLLIDARLKKSIDTWIRDAKAQSKVEYLISL